MPGPGIEPPTSGMPSGRANHYTTAPLTVSPAALDVIDCLSTSCELQINAARVSHFLDAKTCEFSQVPSLSMGIHGTLIL